MNGRAAVSAADWCCVCRSCSYIEPPSTQSRARSIAGAWLATAVLWVRSYFGVAYTRVTVRGFTVDASSNWGHVRFRFLSDPDSARVPRDSWIASESPMTGETVSWRRGLLGLEVGTSQLWGFMLGTHTYFLIVPFWMLLLLFGCVTGCVIRWRSTVATPDRCPECGESTVAAASSGVEQLEQRDTAA
jgi:hypothetical protein